MDHCIVIDGGRKLIVDSAEEYPLHLSVEAIHHCGGSKADKLVVAEVRQITPVVGRAELAACAAAN